MNLHLIYKAQILAKQKGFYKRVIGKLFVSKIDQHHKFLQLFKIFFAWHKYKKRFGRCSSHLWDRYNFFPFKAKKMFSELSRGLSQTSVKIYLDTQIHSIHTNLKPDLHSVQRKSYKICSATS